MKGDTNMSIEEMYRARKKATLKGLLFLLLVPSPGLAIENFVRAKNIDRQIKKTILEEEGKPIVVVCPNQKKA
jgi:hypothetical protein